MKRWVGLRVIGDNLINIDATLSDKRYGFMDAVDGSCRVTSMGIASTAGCLNALANHTLDLNSPSFILCHLN